MFRIDRNLVNLATARYVNVEGEAAAGAEGVPPDASASAAYMMAQAQQTAEQAQQTVADAEATAAKILDTARDEAALLMVTSRDEAEERRRKAWQEGYADGAKEGKSAFEEKYEQKVREDEEMLKRVVSELYDERERMYEGLEDEVVALTFQIAKKVFGMAGDEDEKLFESLIRNALKQVAPEGKIIIRVSPAEYERFFSSGSAVFELDRGITLTTSILRDTALEKGDCIIDTEDETINAGIDTQLEAIRLAFMEIES